MLILTKARLGPNQAPLKAVPTPSSASYLPNHYHLTHLTPNYNTIDIAMKAKLKSLTKRLTPGGDGRVSNLRSRSPMMSFNWDLNDKPRVAIETGRDALGLKELAPGHNPVVE